MKIEVSDNIKYIGVDDLDLDLFESQYITPEGMSYNSYLILDEKICVMDSVDARKTDEWMTNLEAALGSRTPDYIVSLHIEPDHSASVEAMMSKYPTCKYVTSAKGLQFFNQFYDGDLEGRTVIVKEGDTLNLGEHELTFVAAPMVHWPEVMVAYEAKEGVLFSADGFGKFGALVNETEDWLCEARRYYFNIVGKYGAQVQALLKKASALDIKMICPLHGPILKENLEQYIAIYDRWSKYEPESDGVFIAYASIHGNTAKAANYLAELLEQRGVKVALNDLTRDDWAEGVEDAFRYDRMVLCCSTYDAGLFPPMENFIAHLNAKTYRNRKVALVENGTWAPVAAKLMRAELEQMKGIEVVEPVVTIKSAMTDDTKAQLAILADALK